MSRPRGPSDDDDAQAVRTTSHPVNADYPPAVPAGVQAKGGSRAWSWVALMHRAVAIDVLACRHSGGRLRLIATLRDPVVIRTRLAHLGMAPSGPSPGPAPPESRGVAP